MEENMEVETPEEGSEGGVVTAETGAEAEETAGEKKQEAAEPARQSREENARYQAARKAGESAGFRRAEERYQSALAKLGLSDPDGGGAIDSLDVLESYADKARAARLKKAAAESGRTVQDLEEEEDAKEVVRKQKRERAEREKADAEAERQKDWIAQDAAAFVREHPDVDIFQARRKREVPQVLRQPVREGAAERALCRLAGACGRGSRREGGGEGRKKPNAPRERAEGRICRADGRPAEGARRVEPRIPQSENDRQGIFGTLKGEESCILYRMWTAAACCRPPATIPSTRRP